MTRHFVLATVLAGATIGSSLLGGPQRRGAFVGFVVSGLTALVSMALLWQSARSHKPVHAALAIFVIMFLVRLVVAAGATAVVVRGRMNIVEYLVAFVVSYFCFAAIEWRFVDALRSGSGTPV